ncbi:MAG: hypothetical protein S0880_07115 [Actinomycetota bacterium]|nr:hypothetical protein [Actinomycetota bacterium]
MGEPVGAPGHRELTVEEERVARQRAIDLAGELAARRPGLVGLEVTSVGTLSDEDGVFGAVVALELPEPRDVDAVPMIDLRRVDDEYHSTPYEADVDRLVSLAASIELPSAEVIGLYVRPAAGTRSTASIVGEQPEVPVPDRPTPGE